MIRGVLTFLTFISVLLFPWPFAAFLALVSVLWIPLLPLSAGIFADTLYYAPHAGLVPWFAVFGACATLLSYLVRGRLKASIIGR